MKKDALLSMYGISPTVPRIGSCNFRTHRLYWRERDPLVQVGSSPEPLTFGGPKVIGDLDATQKCNGIITKRCNVIVHSIGRSIWHCPTDGGRLPELRKLFQDSAVGRLL